MPFKVATMEEVDSSSATSSFDPDETVLETSMMLLSPKLQRQLTPNISNRMTKEIVDANIHNNDIRQRQNHSECDSADDPDETMLEGGNEEANHFESGTQRPLSTTPLKYSSMLHSEESAAKQKPCDSNPTVIGNYCDRFMEQDNFSDQSHDFFTYVDDENFKRCYNDMKTIIAKHRHLVKLPSLDPNDDVEKRICTLYLYVRESGVQQTIDKLGLNASLMERSCRQKDDSDEAIASYVIKSRDMDRATNYKLSEVASLPPSPGVDSSVEIGRCNSDQKKQNMFYSTSFQSPILMENDRQKSLSKKRQASTSGKKGADLHRKRLDDDNDEHLFRPIYEESSQIECDDILVGSHLGQSFGNNVENHDSRSSTSPHPSSEEEKNHSSFLDSALFSPISHRKSLSVCQDDSFSKLSSSLQTQMSPQFQLESKHVEKGIQYNFEQVDSEDESRKSYWEQGSPQSQNKHKKKIMPSSSPSNSLVNDSRTTSNVTQQKWTPSHFEHEISQVFCTSQDAPSDCCSQDKNSVEYSEEEKSDDASSFVSYPRGDTDSIESVNSIELGPRGQKGKVQHQNSHDKDKTLQYHVTLKGNSHVHYNPLKVYRPPKWAKLYEDKRNNKMKQSRKQKAKGDKDNQASHELNNRSESARPLPTLTMIQNPFKEFGSRDSERLNVVLDWIIDRERDTLNEEESSITGKAAILSLNQRQIICLILQLILLDGRNHSDSISKKNNTFSKHSGGTLIVLKGKDEICEWECELREKTGFSVFNHAVLSSSERRSANITSKASTFDVVLTTYDALKNKEVTVCVDKNGRFRKEADDHGGWLASRTNQIDEEDKVHTAILSRLHPLDWHRAVFIDDLGRKSYLTKPGTSRAEVACSVKGKSRIICFVKSSDEHCFFEDKFKESRRQLIPLAKMFDVPTNRTANDLVGQIMLDYRDVREQENDGEEELSECTSRFSYCSIGMSE